jgi:hypothetical protein
MGSGRKSSHGEDNLLGKRNVTPEEASYLRGKRYNAEKKRGGRPVGKLPQSEGETADRLADEYHVGRATAGRHATGHGAGPRPDAAGPEQPHSSQLEQLGQAGGDYFGTRHILLLLQGAEVDRLAQADPLLMPLARAMQWAG